MKLAHWFVEATRQDIINAANKRCAPSKGCSYNKFSAIQCETNPDAAYNARPLSLSPSPINIYEPAFAIFMEEMARPTKKFKFTAKEYKLAYKLIAISSEYYEDERVLQTGLSELSGLLGFDISDFWITSDFVVKKSVIKPDGSDKIKQHVLCKQPIPVMLMELKLSPDREGDPVAQGVLGFSKIFSSDAVRFVYLGHFFSSLNLREVCNNT